jgi:hypothetical protein
MSCALVTAVTLTAVNRVGHEVGGSTPRLVTPQGVSAQISENSAAAASSDNVTASNGAVPDALPGTTDTTTKPSPTQSGRTGGTGTASSPASPAATGQPSSQPGTSHASVSPSKSPSASFDPTAPVSAPPDSSPASPDPDPTSSVGPKLVIIDPGGSISMVCRDDAFAQATSTVNTGYTKSDVSTNVKVDVTFTKGDVSDRYVYVCINGQPVHDVTERP